MGRGISLALGRDHADVVAAVHVNLLFNVPLADGDAEYRAWAARKVEVLETEGGYMFAQATKPQTIGLALTDSPAGLAAWVLEKCRSWSDSRGDVERRLSRDALVTNIMTYVATGSIGSAIWLYHGARHEPVATGRVEVPCGFAAFPAEYLPAPPRSAAERAFNIVRWTAMPAGGHFAAWEEPELFAQEVCAFFAEWR